MMEERNQTSVTEFILLGLTDDPGIQVLLFLLFLVIYMITLLGNTGIILLTRLDPNLQTPMYFFLCSLSFSDLCYSSVVTPRMLADLLAERKTISFHGCAAQLYFFAVFTSTESFLLSVMAYDRYVAVCKPLLYTSIMNPDVCCQLVAGVFAGGFLISFVHAGCIFSLFFCGPNVINHFYCDFMPLLSLSCSRTITSKTVFFILVVAFGLSSFLITLTSYASIFSTVLKMTSTDGRRKAFSTCASHLTAISLFYGTIFFMYMRLDSGSFMSQNKVASVFYTVVIPMLNPLIYSIKNKEVKRAMRKIIDRNCSKIKVISLFPGQYH
ncbi:olfactory receptor 5G3-like [Rhinatrema bivittatum]|uniref:olfactory receptor 5G3-like n=1 Tax=Rhinatrema bivittatum TaxID=194408 RepID=UPI001127DA04|nr:olfactory receptor 5G3-like [Rhinatrema bivittatum]